MWWQLAAVLNGVIAVCYLLIALTIARGLRRTGQARTNVLAVATAAIFLSCAVHHGSHPVHMLLPALGLEREEGLAMRTAMGWHATVMDLVGAVVAVWYLSLRGRFGPLLGGPSLFTDVSVDRRRAVEINDDVIQGLTTVLYALELDDPVTARAAAQQALTASRTIVGELVGGDGRAVQMGPGDLRREQPAPAATLP